MRIRLTHTNETRDVRYPPGTVTEAFEEREPIAAELYARWRDDPRQVAAWLALGNEITPDGTAVQVTRGIGHFLEVDTIADLFALANDYGPLLLDGHSIELVNDFLE